MYGYKLNLAVMIAVTAANGTASRFRFLLSPFITSVMGTFLPLWCNSMKLTSSQKLWFFSSWVPARCKCCHTCEGVCDITDSEGS